MVAGGGLEYQFFQGKMISFAEARYTDISSQTENTLLDMQRAMGRLGVTWSPSIKNRLSLDGNIFYKKIKGVTNTGTDTIFRLSYEKYF